MRIVVSGTDTDVGKTIFAAALAGALGAHYWKPVQAGLDAPTDSETVERLSGLEPGRILAERYRLATPCSPHRAAAIDGIEIDPAAIVPPDLDPLVIEGAGGLLVPATQEILFADLFARWALPLVLVARTGLGTINHSLLSIEALRARRIAILGIAFVGDAVEDSEATICRIGSVKRLGRLPILASLAPDSLAAAFRENFRIEDFR
ncbi:dethiobiotin synthase [Sphingosinicella rhizophila]|uniref:ATP-dependent dethiobiotin synthetase BioD n=1 Tax=Sphingosinicella rhizophila TaxID=3050082 RepID=A0ABU3QBR1_9SPHN|nr:dethiobiotin synthase [Sphingosinicella sp. GR2756]MDT9600818.1 dethiobiotin synthase [Sphingosinicella sp. GR2756]